MRWETNLKFLFIITRSLPRWLRTRCCLFVCFVGSVWAFGFGTRDECHFISPLPYTSASDPRPLTPDPTCPLRLESVSRWRRFRSRTLSLKKKKFLFWCRLYIKTSGHAQSTHTGLEGVSEGRMRTEETSPLHPPIISFSTWIRSGGPIWKKKIWFQIPNPEPSALEEIYFYERRVGTTERCRVKTIDDASRCIERIKPAGTATRFLGSTKYEQVPTFNLFLSFRQISSLRVTVPRTRVRFPTRPDTFRQRHRDRNTNWNLFFLLMTTWNACRLQKKTKNAELNRRRADALGSTREATRPPGGFCGRTIQKNPAKTNKTTREKNADETQTDEN